jgi:hypothetical protein
MNDDLVIGVALGRRFGPKGTWPEVYRRIEEVIHFHIGDLLTDLGMSGRLRWVLDVQQSDSLGGDAPFRVSIGGVPCRQRVTRTPYDWTPEILGALVANEIFDNRVALVTGASLQRVADNLTTGVLRQPGERERPLITALVRDCVAQGYGLDTAIACLRLLADEDDVQQALAGVLVPSVVIPAPRKATMRVAPAQAAAPEMTGAGDLIRPELFYALGYQLPPMIVEADGSLSGWQMRLVINELKGPIRMPPYEPPSDYYVATTLADDIQQHAWLLMNNAEVDRMLGKLNAAFPMLTFSCIEVLGTPFLGAVVRQLLRERVSVRDLRSIMDALLLVAGHGRVQEIDVDGIAVLPPAAHLVLRPPGGATGPPTVMECADLIRVVLRDAIAQSIAAGGDVVLHRLSPETEAEIQQPSMTPGRRDAIVAHIAVTCAFGVSSNHAVVTRSSRARRVLRDMIDVELPGLPVLCDAELGDAVTWLEGVEIR